ncbi:HAMP domain-containing protein [Nonomuraea sp. K274]|uniref:histidine kinase n=1 Tax=Nonomuraea cypriaca TaxID=1187855 RepID=A0A931EZG7_9ACTN|nr:ATP-binding protein [Nonomuraea cypriaca]MBF8189829.1 HAMP domain-containing protein [Nonomuraea cypriaca]
MIPYPRSIRARSTLVASAFALVALTVVGVTSAVAIRYSVQDGAYARAEQIAGEWSAMARAGRVPRMIPVSGDIDLVELVDTQGRVLAASPAARDHPQLSSMRLPGDDRVQRLTEGCVTVVAMRVAPNPDAPVMLAGRVTPALVHGHRLEYVLTGVALVLVAIVAWSSWAAVGRTLRPVAGIRARMAEITVSDLSLRMEVPPGKDEIAMLVRTANDTLARLDDAVAQQRSFASTTSHELRNPIAGLRMQLEEAIIHRDEVDPHETIHSALAVADRLEAIVGDLLVLARLRADGPAIPELIDLGALVRQEVPRAEGLSVRVHANQDVLVKGSRIQLIRVLGNLLSNALRHADSAVDVFVTASDGQAEVAVADDGAGIARADRERVFERFTRLDDGRRRDAGGSGLGLAISRDIARSHGGTLFVADSTRGARFVLRLPRLDSPVVRPAPAQRADRRQPALSPAKTVLG